MKVELIKKNDRYYIDITKPWEDRGCKDIFTASNGWRLRSIGYPSIGDYSKIFGVSGLNQNMDNYIVYHSSNYPFPREIEKETYDNIKILLTEYKASLEL